MKRIVRIVALHMESVLEHRLRSFVWFLVVLINPLLYILFWQGTSKNGLLVPGWSVSDVNGYYVILIIAQAMLVSHIEEDVSYFDIQQGELDKYLTKPFSYYLIKFIEELPYRLLQGIFAIAGALLMFFILKQNISFHINATSIVFGIITAFFAFALSHVYKMTIGILAFWFTDMKGLFDLLDAVRLVLGGVILPIALYPDLLRKVADFFPFSYALYYPVVVFMGQTSTGEILRIISIQIIWFLFLYGIYRILWKRGIASFTGIGK